jgi:hypothetical protein
MEYQDGEGLHTADREAEDGAPPSKAGHHEEGRNLRGAKRERRHSYGDDSDVEVDSDAEDFHQSCLAECLPALKQYFQSRLEQTIAFLSGNVELLKGWKVQVVKRTNGLTAGLLEIFYFNPRGKKFRSRVEVACFLNLMPSIKSLRTMTKDQFYLNAIENRERHLISQQLALCNFACDEIIFHNDIITLVNLNEPKKDEADATPEVENGEKTAAAVVKTEGDEALGVSFAGAKNVHFTFGNLVVLDWGRIIPDPAFHTTNQLYPLGFKCLRQEHDVTLDRVVDCLCEIDAVFEGGDGASVLYMLKHNLPIDPHRPLQPLFRLSVAWHIGDETSIGTATEQEHVQVRVYEARSPQQAWQAAMLESLGIKDESMLSVRPAGGDTSPRSESSAKTEDKPKVATPRAAPSDAGDEFGNATDTAGSGEEEQDAEELLLRQKIREQRRAYFRVLRAEQSAGMQAAVRPRLSLETVDAFAEDLVLRLFEGMEGSINCRAYQFMDSREREGGKKNMLKSYSKAFTKAKNLDRVIRKNQYLSEQIQQLEQKRKRVEDQESRKRAKIEDKETRSLVLTAQKSRNAKIKEMEKVITAMKVALSKTVKKRRDDAKLAAEMLCDKEEMQRFVRGLGPAANPTGTAGAIPPAGIASSLMDVEATASPEIDASTAAACAGPRPEPASSALILHGHAVGQLLEVWEFLRTFAADVRFTPEQLPSVEQLILAAKVFDPSYRSVRDYTRSLDRSFDKVTQFESLDPSDPAAADVLNKLGVVLTTCLVKDFDRAMGIDLAEMQLGDFSIPINALTWREVARVVFLSTCCRDLGMSDVDVAALIKGRGYFTTPESADRKILKLARRRIKFAYCIRSELQESVFGFASGLCVRLPAPANPFIEGSVLWSDLVASLRQVPDKCGWLIYEIVKAAALSVCIIDTTAAARKLKRALQATLGLSSFRMDNGAETKAAALKILEEEELLSQQWKLTNGRWRNVASGASSASSATSVDGAGAMDTADGSTNAGVAEGAASAREAAQLLRAKLELVYDQTPYTVPTCTLDLWEKQMREALRHADFARPDGAALASSLEDSERDLTSAMEEDAEGENNDVQSVRNDSTRDGEEGSSPSLQAQQLVVDDDTKQAEKLTIAMQRCYLVVRDLMMHPQANPFNWPVDFLVLPSYYKSVAQPLSLSEVRKFLVEGKYKDSIFRFYTDVIMVIENAMAYNQENSAVKVSAQKLLVVFERLFYETVLCWENPLPFQDSCHACRSPHPIPAGKIAVCDRCEGCYHLHCLDPPMQMPPRSEWYCLPCVEQKGIPSAHPYKTADVVHPADPESRGEVVGIEVIRQTVMFVVEFGNVRELWDSRKVRRHALEPPADSSESKAVFTQMDDADRKRNQALGFADSSQSSASLADAAAQAAEFQSIAPAEGAYTMPSGYEYEDYDRVCGIVRAYTGWGASHYLVPPAIMDQHNLAASARSKHDVVFPLYRDCAAALGYAAGGVLGDVLSASEWGTVLNGLLRRVLDGTLISNTLSTLDDGVDDDLVAQIQEGVHVNNLPLEKVFGFIRGEGLVKQVKPVVEEPNPDAPKRRGRKPRVRVETAAPDALKRSNSASSALGGDEDDEGDSEGEYEWDEDVDDAAPAVKTPKQLASTHGSTADLQGGTSGKKEKNGKKGKRVGITAPSDTPTQTSAPAASQAGTEPVDETDSADEDELEFFDADGNCLTSGVVSLGALCTPARAASSNNLNAPDSANGSAADYQMGDAAPRDANGESPSAEDAHGVPERQGPETEDEWSLRLLSRQKGREDALMTHTLVLDTLTQVDVDGSKESEEEVFKLVNQEDLGGSFYQTATSAIVKSCLGRPSESLVAHEWTRGWEGKMTAMQEYLSEYTFKDKEVVCPICGFEESFLSSPMVWGQTSDEWEADVAADTAQDVLTEPEPPNDMNAFPLAAGVSASTGIKGFRARARVMKGLVWMPYDPVEAQVESEECATMKRTIKRGSLVMHECCANFVHFNRQMKQDKSRKMEDQRVVEVITGIGRAKSTPIGIDREGSFYWIFRDCTALFVSTNEHNTLREKSAEKHDHAGSSRWSVYRTAADINTIINWLDAKVPAERVLKKVLSVLFPAAVTSDEYEQHRHALAPVLADAVATSATVDGGASTGVPDGIASLSDKVAGFEIIATEPPLPPQPLSERHPRPSGSLLLSGDIMEQSGDEAGSDDEGRPPSTTAVGAGASGDAGSAMDCDEDDNDAQTVATKNANGAASAPDAVLSPREAALVQVRNEAADNVLRNRPALSQRSPLLDIYAPVEGSLVRVDRSSNTRSAPFKFRRGDHVLVDASPRNHILWDAHVQECKVYRMPAQDASSPEVVQILFYKLRFDRWGAAYDGWYEESQMISSSALVSAVGRAKTTTRAIAQESKINFIHGQIWTPPEILQSLFAYKFLKEPQRACGAAPPLNYSDCHSAVGQLRLAMLMIEAALPFGAVDDSDDRWGEDFVVPWREAVSVASDAIGLMQCQLMLEYGIRTSWLKPTGLKMFSCLPSRVQCVRNATLGLVAVRVWVLDAMVKYDQVKKDDKPISSGKGRPPKYPAGSAPSAKSKKHK